MLLITVLLGYEVIRYFVRMRSNLPPGPTPLPIVGNLLELRKADRLYKAAIGYSNRYKSDVIKIDFGLMGYAVILNSYNAFKKAFLEDIDLMSDRIMTHTFKIFTRNGKDIALAPVSEQWKIRRKLGYQTFRMIAEGDKISIFSASSFKKQKLLMLQQLNVLVNPRKMLAFGVINAISKLTYGKEYEINDEEFEFLNELGEQLIDIVGNGTIIDIFPLLSFLPINSTKRLKKIVDRSEEIIMRNFRLHEESFDENEIRNISDAIIKLRISSKFSKDVTDENIFFLIFNIFGAGTDTPVNILNWMIIYVCNNSEIQQKVYEELSSFACEGNPPNWHDREKLPYTQAFMHELLRLSSVTPLGIPHKPSTDCKFMGFDISKESIVLPNIYAIHRDPQYWKDPEVFNPERFFDENGRVSHIQESYFPFGLGRRVCLGESIARPLLFNFISNLLYTFEFYVPEEHPMPTLEGMENQALYIPDPNYKVAYRLR